MPRMDGTGPMGAGPMTGRGMGLCGQSETTHIPRYESAFASSSGAGYSPRIGGGRGSGRGSGAGPGRNRGRRKGLPFFNRRP